MKMKKKKKRKKKKTFSIQLINPKSLLIFIFKRTGFNRKKFTFKYEDSSSKALEVTR